MDCALWATPSHGHSGISQALFRKQTKYALRGAPNPDEVSVPVENEEECCCICLEPIEESKTVTLRLRLNFRACTISPSAVRQV